MFGLFKKKADTVRTQILPAELWQGEVGRALREAGLSSEDPKNFVSHASAMDARLAQARVALELQVERENAELARTHPGCSLAPMYIFTEAVWKGPHGKLLTETLELTPHDDWNVRMLAADKHSADALGLPRTYTAEIPHFQDMINRLLAELVAEKRSAANFKHEATRDIWGLSNYIWEEHIKPGLAE